jgi:Domain of unknown function (DUF4145)
MMVTAGQNWKCPYCGHAQVIDEQRIRDHWHAQSVQGWIEDGRPTVNILAIICANDECRKLTLSISLGHAVVRGARDFAVEGPFNHWSLLPTSSAKPQPDCIPEPIRNDYYEACAIRDLSPKASATITRRCLQGMIRDFCGISKRRLVDEIEELRKRVDSGKAPLGVQADSLDAIDAVRKIGNIGAHMEMDINVIVDVDPNEAQTLIELVEALFVEWYIAAESRKKRFGHLQSIAAEKAQQKKGETGEPVEAK